MKKITCLFLFFISINLFAQKEASNWFFGINAGIHFQDDGSVNVLTNSAIQTNEGCSSISDSSGNLLFYTDGRNVWDRNSILMPNGNYAEGTGLMGDPSSSQSAIIIPKMGDANIYYIFTVDEPHHDNAAAYPEQFAGTYTDGGTVPADDDGFNNGFNYSVVDLSITGENGSIGDISSRNNHLVTYDPANLEELRYKCSEKVTALKNNTGTGYWVITHFIDKFYAFSVTEAGVNATPVVTQISPVVSLSGYRRNSIGCLKASPNGKKIAVAHNQLGTQTGIIEENGTAVLYDLDNATGIISNPLVISQNTVPYGVEFSQKSRKLYISYDPANGINGVHQYNLLSADIPASDVLVANTSQSGTLQLGPNGKIYKAVVSSSNLDVINNPEEDGALCSYGVNQLSLNPGKSYFGLPPFITSYFSVSIVAKKLCLNDVTEFTLNIDEEFNSVAWDFGDGTPMTAPFTGTTATHQYASAGTYTVVAKITHQGETSYVNSTVTIALVPVANAATAITTCDPDNDGITVFDLTQNTPMILGAQSSTLNSVKYFGSQLDAETNAGALNAQAYTNHTTPETIYVRIQNNASPECYQTTSFTIQALRSPVVKGIQEVIICRNDPTGTTLTAVSGLSSAQHTYLWNTGETTNTIRIHSPGTYKVTITNEAGCSNDQTYLAKPSDLAVIEDIIVSDFRDNNTVTVIAGPPAGVSTSYVYGLDNPNGPYGESNFFENVSPGIHTIYISDVSGCGIVSKEITVLTVPKFFTPNQDGVNDTWNIIGVNTFFYPNSKIYVFDRYGQLLADIDPKGIGWDGNYHGRRLPADDYWYVVALDDGRTIKGHFSLLR
ncbi:T9SS type B sorting domain-containing protein [Flavobacterium sp. DG1-102-2]|uniref:T9SS type B sorting domain-containing protein n=1 Tax=Flavobacterium sp. DG1-102-2 TaxID=3081663 RepID=UPI002949FF00|nr:T9SS type B sorting domain-containing protein [Flavobacterium sp. DG1-102-2]MDV6168035.1 T9SS type B sorting domain-containing protein [Flavobacterium sp. DG1-102-2]